MYAVGLPLAMRFTEVSELYEYFLVLVLQGMILVAMALSLIRLLIHYSKIVRDYLSPEVKVNNEANEANEANEENEIEEENQENIGCGTRSPKGQKSVLKELINPRLSKIWMR